MSEAPLLRIREWLARFENNRTKELRRMTWIPEPTDLSSDTFAAIVDHPDGPAHFGVMIAIHMVASKGVPRGYLRKEDGRPHDAQSIARVVRMPEKLVHDVITRLLEIGELESGNDKPRKRLRLASQLPAAIPRHPAEKLALQEGNGREGITSSSQEGKTEERSSTDQEQHGVHENTETPLSKFDDDEKPKPTYPNPEDELKHIYQQKAGEPITIAVLTGIRETLELKGVTMTQFLTEIRKHAANHWKNPAGFLRGKANKFRSETAPAPAKTVQDLVVQTEDKCSLCGSRRGEGLVLQNRQTIACSCATPEFIQRMEARGVLVGGSVQ